eukprot:scaffold3031_cov28-Tisochrysis_lutea.AAC.3
MSVGSCGPLCGFVGPCCLLRRVPLLSFVIIAKTYLSMVFHVSRSLSRGIYSPQKCVRKAGSEGKEGEWAWLRKRTPVPRIEDDVNGVALQLAPELQSSAHRGYRVERLFPEFGELACPSYAASNLCVGVVVEREAERDGRWLHTNTPEAGDYAARRIT